MESRLLLNVVVGEGSSVLKLLSSKDETLLVGSCSDAGQVAQRDAWRIGERRQQIGGH